MYMHTVQHDTRVQTNAARLPWMGAWSSWLCGVPGSQVYDPDLVHAHRYALAFRPAKHARTTNRSNEVTCDYGGHASRAAFVISTSRTEYFSFRKNQVITPRPVCCTNALRHSTTVFIQGVATAVQSSMKNKSLADVRQQYSSLHRSHRSVESYNGASVVTVKS